MNFLSDTKNEHKNKNIDSVQHDKHAFYGTVFFVSE